MSSHFVVPNWRNLNHQKQLEEQIKVEEEATPQGGGRGGGGGGGETERNRSSSSSTSYVHSTQPFSTLSLPIMSSNYEVAELTWENGQLAMHGLSCGGGLPSSDPAAKPLWNRVASDTLESIVHQAATACPNPNSNPNLDHHQSHNPPTNLDSLVASSSEKWTDQNTCQMGPKPMKKRSRSESVPVRRNCSASDFPRRLDGSGCASATFFGDTDTNMMTVTSSGYSPCSLKAKNTDEDSTFHDSRRVNQDEECDLTKTDQTARSHSSRRIRVAAVHNQSERKRRDRINQKMKALQKLVPNSSKTDKASMLDEVIGYLKQLQTQIQMIQSVGNTMPHPHQMLMPSAAMGIQQQQQQQQQQLQQMSLLARMAAGMGLGGIGMGMMDMNSIASSAFPSLLPQPTRPAIPTTTPAFVPSPFLVPQMMQARVNMPMPASSNNILNPPLPMPNPYSALLQQSMNMDLYNKMAAFYGQPFKQTTQETMSSNSSQAKHIHNRD